MSSENRPKDFFAKQIRSSHLIASGGIIDPNSSDWDVTYDNLKLMIYPKDVLEVPAFGGGAPSYIDGAFEGIVPPQLLEDTGGTGLKVGDDVWLFISGAQNTHSVDHDGADGIELDEKEKRANGGVVLFGGDVVISGTLFAERQVVEVDLSQEGELFVSGNLKVQDYTADTKFIQFMMPIENYPEQWRRRALSFTDLEDGGPAIDITNIVDGNGAGVFNLSLYSSFDTSNPFPMSALNHTITNYKNELIQPAIAAAPGGEVWDSVLAFQDVVDAIVAMDNVTDFDVSEPYTSDTIATLVSNLNTISADLSSAGTLSVDAAGGLYNQKMSELSTIESNCNGILLHLRNKLSDHDADIATEDETPGGVTDSAISSAETLLATAIGSATSHIKGPAFNAAPASPSEYESRADVIAAGTAYSGFSPGETGDPDEELTIFNVDSLNGRVGVLNVDPAASLDLRPGYGLGQTPTNVDTDHQIEDNTGTLQDVQLYVEGGPHPAPGESIFWHLTNKTEPLAWSHADAASAPEVFRIIGLKEDVTNYGTAGIEPKVLTITDDGYVRFKEGGLGGATLKEDRDGRQNPDDLDTNESTLAADGATAIWGDDYDPANPDVTVAGSPYDNGYFEGRWHGDTKVGHALDDVNQALKTINENNAWLWPDTDGVEGGDKVTLRDATNLVGIGTDNPVQKLHVHSGEGLNTAIRIEAGEVDNSGNVINPDAHSKIEFAIGNTTHSSIRQQVRPGLDSTAGTDLLLQNHMISGGHYLTTTHLVDGIEYALAPFVIDANRNAEGEELQVLILSGTTGEDASGLNPRLFADTNFFVSGSIGSCVNPVDQEGVSIQPGNGQRGTAVFGGDVYVSGTIFGANGVVGAGGGWMTAMNGVCIDVFTEPAAGSDSETRAFDIQPFLTQLNNTGLIPDNSNDDFSVVDVKFLSTIGGDAVNGTVVNVELTSSTASLNPVDIINWDSAAKVLNIEIPLSWTADGGLTYNDPNLDDIISCINGTYVGFTYPTDPADMWPIKAEAVIAWSSTNVALSDIGTDNNLHIPPPGSGTITWTWTLQEGGHSFRYVSWGADATSGNSPSEGMSDSTGDTFTRQDWAQGLIIPFNCNIVGYSVRYMSRDPLHMTDTAIAPNGNEQVIWEIGFLNEGTDPDILEGDLADFVSDAVPIKRKEFMEIPGIQWIRWTSADDGTYPLKWIGEGDDGDDNHSSEMNIPVSAGQTIAIRALEKNVEVFGDYRAEASVTLWLAGGGSINLGSGSANGGMPDPGNNSGAINENSVRSINILTPSDAVLTYNNPYGESEDKLIPDLTAIINYISLTYVQGDNMLIELPDAGLATGYTFIIKDSMGMASATDTNIRIAPPVGQTLDQFRNWQVDGGGNYFVGQDSYGNNAEPLKIEQDFASITVWSDGQRWLIS